MWSHAVHPTQVYEAIMSLVVAFVCLAIVHPRKRYDGQVFAVFLALYAVLRAVIEVWRKDDRGGIAFLSTSQLIGIALLIGAIAIHLVRSKKTSDAVPAAP
jgi:phosphatidylglycerol:prolipoprotein diacylglycerol transferase